MPQDLKEWIKNGKGSVWLIFGEEPWLAEEEIKEFRELLNPDFAPLNITLMEDKNLDINRLIETLEAVPFMDEFRLVMIRNSEIFKTGDKGLKKPEEEALLRYLDNPSISTILLFAPREVDKRSGLYKKIKKNHRIIETKRLDMMGLRKWCKENIKTLDFKMEDKLLELFLHRTGYLNKDSQRDLAFLHQELMKLASLYGEGRKIQEEDILELFQEEMDSDVFKFTDLMIQGKRSKALLMYNDMVDKGESPLMFLTMMARQFSLIGRCHLLLDKGYSSSMIAQKLDIHPYAAKKAVESCKYINAKVSKEMLKTCLDTELRIKTGKVKEHIGVELMISRVGQRLNA